MKRKTTGTLLFMLIACFLILTFTGCNQTYRTTASSQEISLDFLNQFSKVYINANDATDRVGYKSFGLYKQSIQKKGLQGAIVEFHYVESTPYISVSHQGDDIYVSGKTVSKCIIDTVGETFNGYQPETGSTFVIEQEYYFEPVSEEDCIIMFEEFGAKFQKDKDGNLVGMRISDGDYALELKNDVEYKLKLHQDELPLSIGQNYSGLLLFKNGKVSAEYILPEENIDLYSSFAVSDEYYTIAAEIQQTFEAELN